MGPDGGWGGLFLFLFFLFVLYLQQYLLLWNLLSFILKKPFQLSFSQCQNSAFLKKSYTFHLFVSLFKVGFSQAAYSQSYIFIQSNAFFLIEILNSFTYVVIYLIRLKSIILPFLFYFFHLLFVPLYFSPFFWIH